MSGAVVKHENEVSKLQYEIDFLKDEVGTLKAIEGKKIDLVCASFEDKLSLFKND